MTHQEFLVKFNLDTTKLTHSIGIAKREVELAYQKGLESREATTKANLTLLFQTEDKTWRQARIQALKVYQVAKQIALQTSDSMDVIIPRLVFMINGPTKPLNSKPKTFELWFVQRTYKRFQFCI